MSDFHVESTTYVDEGHWLFPRLRIRLRLSTVQLPGNFGYETCLFRRDGSSDVIEHYETLDEAMAGHYHHAKHYGFTTIKIKCFTTIKIK